MNITRHDIYEGISNASNVLTVFAWIDRALARTDNEPELDRNVVMDCCLYGINRMAELTIDDPKLAQELLTGRILDLCIEDDDVEVKHYHYAEARKSVVKWMEQYAEAEMCNIRQALISQVVQRLQQSPHQDLVWMIATIGYRTEEVTSVLKEVVSSEESDQAARYAALSTLCSLGNLSDEDKEKFRLFAETHLKLTTSIPLFSTLRLLKSPQSTDYLLDSLNNSSTEQQETFFPDLCLGALSEIAETHPEFAKQIWDGVVHTVTVNKGTERRPRISELIFNKSLLNRFDLPDVPEQLFKFLVERLDMDEQSKHVRYLIYLRLTELTGRQQLAGLGPEQNPQVMEVLKADCILNTTNVTRSMSSEDRLKEAAWDVALRMGLSEVFDWFNAVTDEVSPFMRGRILKYLACFSRQTLPDIIGTWLTTRLDWSGNDFPEIFYIEPAIKMAAYSSDPRAFNWLLDFGVTYRGDVPTNAAEGLASYCLERIATSEDSDAVTRDLVAQLIAAFQADWNWKTDRIKQRRVLAAVALEAIASRNLLIETEQQIVKTIFNELDFAEDIIALCPLATIVATGSPDPQIMNRVEELAIQANSWVAAHGIYALDRAGKVNDSARVLEKQGLVLSDEKWIVTNPSMLSEQGAYLLGRFYLYSQSAAKDAVILVVEQGNWRAVSRLIATVSKELSVGDISNEFANAIAARIFSKMSYAYSENYLFKELSSFSPAVFISISWNRYWNDWSSESLVALIQAIRASRHADAYAQSLAIALLSELGLASAQEVRQEAWLAWNMLDDNSFIEAIDRRAPANTESTSVSERRLAAEACWLIQDEAKFLDISSRLKDDPDRRVREACIESTKIREEKIQARESLNKVISSLATDSLMLAAWKYGDTLVELGGVEHLDELLSFISRPEIPPNRRYWLSQLTEKMEKKIKEKKRKSTQDWSPTGSNVVRSEGVVSAGGIEYEAIFVIRKWVPDKLGECQRWDGDGWIAGNSSHFPFSVEHIEIKLNNGDCGTAMISSSNLYSFSFFGIGLIGAAKS